MQTTIVPIIVWLGPVHNHNFPEVTLPWKEEQHCGGFSGSAPTERRPLFLGASWTFVTLDPGEVLWNTGAQEGLIGKQQLDKWCKLLAEHRLQVEWSQEKPRIWKWNRRRDATNRCGVRASCLGWMQRYHSIHCCGAGCLSPNCRWG